ncbi:hypothetical protein [Niabella aquatica]
MQPLLYNTEDLKGPLTQVFFARQFAEYEGAFYYNRLARVSFERPGVNKSIPGGIPLIETLLLGEKQSEHSTLHLCIRAAHSCCKVATGYHPSRTVVLHPEYRTALLLDYLSDKEIEQVFAYIWDHPEWIEPVDPPHSGLD